MKTDNWFSSWFNTPYYHILYKHRDNADAQLFIKNITDFLQLPTTSHIIDLPCGKGRHAVYLNSLGYTVTGADLSENSIQYAKQFENNTLHFKVWDMRKPLQNKYQAIFNLFTSFGYFSSDNEDINVLKAMQKGLEKKGVLVLDFLNAKKVKANLISEEIKIIEDITFTIHREIKDGFIFKHISFFADGKEQSFTERVKYLDLEKFTTYFKTVGLKIMHTFGNYNLDSFNPKTSDRLIFVVQ